MIDGILSNVSKASRDISSGSISKTNTSLMYGNGDANAHFSDNGQFAFQPLAYTAGYAANYVQGVESAFDAKLRKYIEGTTCDRLFATKPDSELGRMLDSARKLLEKAEKHAGEARSSTNDMLNVTKLYNRYVRDDSTGKYDALLDNRDGGAVAGAIRDTYKFVCTTLYGNVMLAIDLVESLAILPAKMAKILLSQIDKFANFLDLLNNAWSSCLSGRLDAILAYVDGIAMPRFDFTFLRNVAMECPQIFCGLSFTITQPAVFKCDRKSGQYNGIDAIGAAEDMLNAELECLKDKIVSLVASGINPIKDVIRSVHDSIAELIRSAAKYAKDFIGSLVKSYLKMITKKRPIPSQFQWLFYENGCGKVKRASLMDWFQALDRFSRCVSTLCALLSKEVREKIANLDLLLRLQFKWWKDYSVASDVLSQLSGPQDPMKLRVSYIVSPPLDGNDLEDSISRRLPKAAKPPIAVNPKFASLSNGTMRLSNSIQADLANFYASRRGKSVLSAHVISDIGRWDSDYMKSDAVLSLKVEVANELAFMDSVQLGEIQKMPSDFSINFTNQEVPLAKTRIDAYKRMIGELR